jgi:hypothetical protein
MLLKIPFDPEINKASNLKRIQTINDNKKASRTRNSKKTPSFPVGESPARKPPPE